MTFVIGIILWPVYAFVKGYRSVSAHDDTEVNSYQMPTLNWSQGLTID